MLRIKQEKEEMDRSYKEQIYANDTTIREKGMHYCISVSVPIVQIRNSIDYLLKLNHEYVWASCYNIRNS
jgi:hypothetical protein